MNAHPEMETTDLDALFRLPPTKPRGRPAAAPVVLTIQEETVKTTTPEGLTCSMPVSDWLAKAAPENLRTGELILPAGLKSILSAGPVTTLVWEHPPRRHNLNWIANDSPVPFGPGVTYRPVRLALPYVIIMATFLNDARGLPQLTKHNECFFRNLPLRSLDDEVCYPALLNCSKFDPPHGRALSWICTQHLKPNPQMNSAQPHERLLGALEALRQCLLEDSFNLSSDHHEAGSWFSLSRGVDPRLATVEAWQAASEKDPLFVLEVPWLKTGYSVRQVAERTFGILRASSQRPRHAAALARLVCNQPTAPAEQDALAAEHLAIKKALMQLL